MLSLSKKKYIITLFFMMLFQVFSPLRINNESEEVDHDLVLTNLYSEEIVIEPKVEAHHLGKFKITAYCHCEQCCGKSDGITATGSKVAPNRTIAVDPNIIPLGSQVMIEGQIYVAEDVGGAIDGNRIDVYFSTHQEALNFGVQYKHVSILKEV